MPTVPRRTLFSPNLDPHLHRGAASEVDGSKHHKHTANGHRAMKIDVVDTGCHNRSPRMTAGADRRTDIDPMHDTPAHRVPQGVRVIRHDNFGHLDTTFFDQPAGKFTHGIWTVCQRSLGPKPEERRAALRLLPGTGYCLFCPFTWIGISSSSTGAWTSNNCATPLFIANTPRSCSSSSNGTRSENRPFAVA